MLPCSFHLVSFSFGRKTTSMLQREKRKEEKEDDFVFPSPPPISLSLIMLFPNLVECYLES